MPYDKKTDPARVNVEIARGLIQQRASAEGFLDAQEFSLVRIGDVSPGDESSYASAPVVCIRANGAPFGDRPYSVHTAVLVAEEDGVRGVRLIDGTYDLTVEQAAAKIGL